MGESDFPGFWRLGLSVTLMLLKTTGKGIEDDESDIDSVASGPVKDIDL